MPSISKIPLDIHRYATKCAFDIRNKKVEYAQGINFIDNQVVKKSRQKKGKLTTVKYNFKTKPKNVFWHNHVKSPDNFRELSHNDILVAIREDIKKIIASTEDGYTSIDFTTVKKDVTKQQMIEWMFCKRAIFNVEKLFAVAKENLEKIHYNNLKDFAKFSGATFSDVKWSDYEKVKNRGTLNAKH